MWSYYGAKTNIVDFYPPPKHSTIIEPFAGSARYALKYFDREVLLIDKYLPVVELWQWLQQCSPKDVMALPTFLAGQHFDGFQYDNSAARLLTSFLHSCGDSRARNTPTKRKTTDRPNHVAFNKRRIADSLHKIKHWTICHGDYSDCPNSTATWFVDPPYQHGGGAYPMSNRMIDFERLAEWVRTRAGQTIVCENTRATWMDFKPLRSQRGSLKSSVEAIWSNCPLAVDWRQQELIF